VKRLGSLAEIVYFSGVKRIILQFGLLAVALLALFQLSKLSLLTVGWSKEFLVVGLGVLFIAFGVVTSRLLWRKPEVENAVEAASAIRSYDELGLSEREFEVLQLIAKGLSNKEIGKQLFISESTVKTHVSNILGKLDAKRRTQAVEQARASGIL